MMPSWHRTTSGWRAAFTLAEMPEKENTSV